MLKKARPELHVMLMCGVPSGNPLVLNYGWAYIQKPFVAAKLVEMVNDVLHSPRLTHRCYRAQLPRAANSCEAASPQKSPHSAVNGTFIGDVRFAGV